MRTKTQLLKTASTLKDFSSKIQQAQIGETLTPEAVQDMAMEIKEVAEVAAEIAEEIVENVPAEEAVSEERVETEQIEVAQNGDEEDRIKKENEEMRSRQAQDGEDDDEKKKLREQVASLAKDLTGLKREASLAKLAPKYASLFPKVMHEAKMNEILNSKQPLNIIEAKIQEASDIITNKTMVKVASMSDSIFDLGNDTDSEEVNIAAKM